MTDAWTIAAQAADRARIVVRELPGIDDMAEAAALLDRVWQMDAGAHSENHPALFQALAHAGNYVVGAWSVNDGQMVGASVAFFGPPAESLLHSHITGTLGIGRGIGAALKWHQRAWALDRGVRTIGWTFDPLIARNAHFNLVRLGARPISYLENVYGVMPDARNAGQPSDRLYATWPLSSPETDATADGLQSSEHTGAWMLQVGSGQEPVTSAHVGSSARVQVPPDIETLRRTDPTLALAWRYAARSVFTDLFAHGYRVTGFHGRDTYVLERAT